MENLEIKAATFADIAQISALVESSYRGESAKAGWTFESDLIDGKRLNEGELEEILTNPNKKLFIARQNQELVGTICLYRDNEICEFGMFAVNPQFQANGIGKILLSHVENFAKNEWGIAEMQLSVISVRQNLIEYYLRRGYRSVGKTFSMADHHLNDDMTKGHDLTLEIYRKKL